jgi:L-fuculose-phosphate aldolase
MSKFQIWAEVNSMSEKENDKLEKLKEEIVKYSRRMTEKELVLGTSGNISTRSGDRFAITPSNLDYSLMSSKDVLILNMNGEVIFGERNPSSEKLMHLKIYKKREDVKAIIHTHSKYASVIASLELSIPPFLDEMVNYLGGEIKTARYALPGSEELAQNVVEALEDRNGALISHHGTLSCGKDLKTAFENALRLERISEIYIISHIIGKPKSIPEESIELEKAIFEMMKNP